MSACHRGMRREALPLWINALAYRFCFFGVARKLQLGPPNFPQPPPLIRPGQNAEIHIMDVIFRTSFSELVQFCASALLSGGIVSDLTRYGQNCPDLVRFEQICSDLVRYLIIFVLTRSDLFRFVQIRPDVFGLDQT